VTAPVVSGARNDLRWAAGAVATVLLAFGLVLVGDHHYFWYGDTAAAYYGWWYHLGDLVRHGDWTTLDPHAWRAGNYAAEGQWALWSPLTIGIGLLATVVGDMLLVTTLVKLGLVAVGVVGVYLLVRSYDAPPPAAYTAGVLVPMGGMTQYLDLPSWAAGLMIWALFPWVWWGLRRTMLHGANPLPALVAGYLLVTVGYVFGTIMLIAVLLACLLDCLLLRDRKGLLRVLLAGVLMGLVALTVYLPGVLTASVTARQTGVHLFGGKFTTDPLAMFAGVLPTTSVSGTSHSLLPYHYLVWLLPVLCWVDLRRLREGWRSLGGLLALTAVTLGIVDGISQIGPLRWPLRLEPFLVITLAVLLVVVWHRFGLARPSGRRLGYSLGWVVIAATLSLVRTSSEWRAHLSALVLVGAALAGVWWLVRRRELGRVAVFAGAATVLVVVLQHAFFPTPPSPQRNAPTHVSAYAGLYPAATGDLLQVGGTDAENRADPAAARQLPIGSAWYLTGLRAQNTYTAISQLAYKNRYCIYYEGDTCSSLLGTLFSTEPTTGRLRVDLLGVSSLLLVRASLPAETLQNPPSGWRIAEQTPYAVLWTRTTPIAGAGSVAWTSSGTSVSHVEVGATRTSFHVDAVPAQGGTVVLRLLDWPGYHVSGASLAGSVDGYLLTVHVPATSSGRAVDVQFHPPGWTVEILAWALALVVGAGWSIGAEVRRRRARTAIG